MMDRPNISQEKLLGHNPRITISGIEIDVLNAQDTVELVEQYVISKTPLHLMGVNADKINEVNTNPKMKEIVNSCGIINADGASVVMASRYLGRPLPERVAGIDLMVSLAALSERKHYTVYLLGAKQEVADQAAQKLKEQFPLLQILGVHNGYFQESDWPEISQELKALTPDFVFVGITSPIKEYLIEYLQNDGNNCVFMGVGGSFDVISGNISRAPKWMQKCGLEWLFRLMHEPRRLFRRYFVGNWKFIRTILSEKGILRK